MKAGPSINLKRFIVFQFIVLVVGLVGTTFFGYKSFLSFLMGGGVMLLANTLMLSRFFIRKRYFSSLKELMFLYIGEVLKLSVVAVGTILIVIYLKPKFVFYFMGLIFLQIAMWMMPLFLKKQDK